MRPAGEDEFFGAEVTGPMGAWCLSVRPRAPSVLSACTLEKHGTSGSFYREGPRSREQCPRSRELATIILFVLISLL